MSDAVPISPSSQVAEAAGNNPPVANDEAAIRESLKRCSPATVDAAIGYRKTKDASLLPTVIIGVIERFVEPDLRAKLKSADDELRLVEDLGIDSLTMMEIVILVEDVLQMQINNEELRNLRTVGDVKVFIDCKVRGLPLPKPMKFYPIEAIAALMPMQPPFLFLNEASINNLGAQGKYKITGQEFFLQGHFKDDPVMPGSMLLESLGQLAVLFLLSGSAAEEGKTVDAKKIFFTSCEGVRCHRICRPGDTLSLSIKPKRMKMPLATFEGTIRVGQEKAALAEEITLTFAYADALPAPEVSPAVAAVTPTAEVPKVNGVGPHSAAVPARTSTPTAAA
ncbi:MAG TPA: phosphopantetheine-binding protein [Opitutaceae bacterium]